MGFLNGSDGKESACNAGDSSLIPGSGGSPGEGSGYPLQCSREFHGQRSLTGYSFIGLQRVKHDWATNTFSLRSRCGCWGASPGLKHAGPQSLSGMVNSRTLTWSKAGLALFLGLLGFQDPLDQCTQAVAYKSNLPLCWDPGPWHPRWGRHFSLHFLEFLPWASTFLQSSYCYFLKLHSQHIIKATPTPANIYWAFIVVRHCQHFI